MHTNISLFQKLTQVDWLTLRTVEISKIKFDYDFLVINIPYFMVTYKCADMNLFMTTAL